MGISGIRSIPRLAACRSCAAVPIALVSDAQELVEVCMRRICQDDF